jgi:hypothetical protein
MSNKLKPALLLLGLRALVFEFHLIALLVLAVLALITFIVLTELDNDTYE